MCAWCHSAISRTANTLCSNRHCLNQSLHHFRFRRIELGLALLLLGTVGLDEADGRHVVWPRETLDLRGPTSHRKLHWVLRRVAADLPSVFRANAGLQPERHPNPNSGQKLSGHSGCSQVSFIPIPGFQAAFRHRRFEQRTDRARVFRDRGEQEFMATQREHRLSFVPILGDDRVTSELCVQQKRHQPSRVHHSSWARNGVETQAISSPKPSSSLNYALCICTLKLHPKGREYSDSERPLSSASNHA